MSSVRNAVFGLSSRNSNSGPVDPAAVGQTADSYVESKIRALEGLTLQAYRAKDLRTLDKILDQGFVSIGYDGEERSKAEVLVRVKEVASPQYLVEQIDVRLHGETAIATGLYEMRGFLHGKAFVEHGRFVDTWLNKDGQWVVIASLSTPAK